MDLNLVYRMTLAESGVELRFKCEVVLVMRLSSIL